MVGTWARHVGRFILGVGLLGTVFLGAVVAQDEDVPPVPHAFYGAVRINGEPAPVGTAIEARGPDVLTGAPDFNNPIAVEEEGRYGGPALLDERLLVQADMSDGEAGLQDGDLITFFVNGTQAECYDPSVEEWVDGVPFEEGEVTELDLRVETAPPTPGPSPTPSATPTPSPTPSATPTSTPGPSPTPTATSTRPPDMPTPIRTNTPSASPTQTAAEPSATATEPVGEEATASATAMPDGATAPGEEGTAPTESGVSVETAAPDETATDSEEDGTRTSSPAPSGESDGRGEGGLPALYIAAGVLALAGLAAVVVGALGLRRRGK